MATALALAALALLMAGAALALWLHARGQAARAASTAFLQDHLAQRAAPGRADAAGPGHAARPWRPGPARWADFVLRAGVEPDMRFHVRMALVPICAALLAGLTLGGVAAGAALVMAAAGCMFWLWLKAQRRHAKAVEQLPDFLESMVRLMAIGNSLDAAFQGAAEKGEQPLRGILQRAAVAARGGMELDDALRQAARQFGLRELYLMAAIVGVATRFGGRSDQVLDRMAGFMRDLTQARRELSALSAEVRLSAWVLALLPLCVGGIILAFNDALFVGMWRDPVGWKLLVGAAALQVVGSYWLYRMAKLGGST